MIDRRRLLLGATALPFCAGPSRAGDEPVRLRDLYAKDLSFSDYARAQEGRRIAVEGYMAPPLKAEALFFVLTLRPMAVCPFCDTETDWPADILAVYTKRPVVAAPFNAPIAATGVLRLGGFTDPDTGFVSRVRLEDAVFRRL